MFSHANRLANSQSLSQSDCSSDCCTDCATDRIAYSNHSISYQTLSMLIVICIALTAIILSGISHVAAGTQQSIIQNQYEVYEQASDSISNQAGNKRASGILTIYLFWGDGCQHCKALMEFLQQYQQEHPGMIHVIGFETWQDEDNAAVRDRIEHDYDIHTDEVPLLIIGNHIFQGYDEDNPDDDEIAKAIQDEYAQYNRANIIEKYR